MYIKTGKPCGQRGEKHYCAKLTKTQVLQIVRNYKPRHKKFSARQIARDLGITQGSVSQILRGRSWAHVTGIKPTPKQIKKQILIGCDECPEFFHVVEDGQLHQRKKEGSPVFCDGCKDLAVRGNSRW